MKHLRLATILIFGILSLSLPTVAQTGGNVRTYSYSDDNTYLALYVYGGTKTQLVDGNYHGNGKSCGISGSFFLATGRVKARCKTDGEVLDVTGFKLTNQDAFQLTVGKYTFVLRPETRDVSGTWHIQQNGGGRSYEGNLYLKVEKGDLITAGNFVGTAVWNNHQQGKVVGKYESDGVSSYVTFTIYYAEGLEGYYKARLSRNGTDMVDGTARANKGGPEVSWIAKRVSR